MKKEIIKKREEIPDDEPSWYHYVIVILVILAIGSVIYFAANWYLTNQEFGESLNTTRESYLYGFSVNGKDFRMEFFDTFDNIEKYPYPVEISKWDILNTQEFYISFLEYNGSDNGEVTKVSTRLFMLLKGVYDFPFTQEHFVSYENVTCANSTLDNKVIVLNPYANQTQINYHQENGCIEFEATSTQELIRVGDKFFYNLLANDTQ